MIFADTGAWFALLVPSDVNHAEAVEWAAANRDEVMTSDMVVVETLTLLRARRQNHVALQLGEQFFDGTVRVERVTTQDLREAWQVFRRYADKDWSFTDCTSLVLMQRLDIKAAFSFDHHFRQFGTITIVP